MPSITPFGKQAAAAQAIETSRDDGQARHRSGSPLFASRVANLVAIAVLLVTADYVWSEVNTEGRSKFYSELTGVSSFADLFEENEAIYEDVVRQLGEPPDEKRQPTFAETMKFANDLPNRFQDVSRQLAAASDRDEKRTPNPPATGSPAKPQKVWRELSLQDVESLRENAKTQFSSINEALGIRSRVDRDHRFDRMDKLVSTLAVDWSQLGPAEKRKKIVRINKQTAAVFDDLLPMPTAYSDIELHAIEPVGTRMRYSYVVNAGQSVSTVAEIGKTLRDEICDREVTRTILKNGGAYDVAFHNPDDTLVHQLTVTESGCQ